MTLSDYHYSIRYKSGRFLGNADVLSRLPQAQTTSSDCLPGDLVHLMNHLSNTAASSDKVRLWIDRDPILSQVKKYLRSGWPQKNLKKEIKPYSLRVKEHSVCWGRMHLVGS